MVGVTANPGWHRPERARLPLPPRAESGGGQARTLNLWSPHTAQNGCGSTRHHVHIATSRKRGERSTLTVSQRPHLTARELFLRKEAEDSGNTQQFLPRAAGLLKAEPERVSGVIQDPVTHQLRGSAPPPGLRVGLARTLC